MKIFIITMEDPLYISPFIQRIVKVKGNEVVGIAISKYDRFTIGPGKSKIGYLLSLLLIMGIIPFIKNSLVTVIFKIRKKLSVFPPLFKDPGLKGFAEKMGIAIYQVSNPNNPEFIEILRKYELDVIINQSQHILKKELLDVPKMGVLNRHNALLPKNRGRLTPFWVLYKNEKETGVSIHFVEEGIDTGPIIIQEKYDISPRDNFNTLVETNYKIAPKAMLKALEKLEHGEKSYLLNDDKYATYNSTPTIKEALKYRLNRIWGLFSG